MSTSTVFVNNRSQAVRMPADATCDSFFLVAPSVSDDFMNERTSQLQSDRKSF